jgi:hypothetical protein
MADSAEASHDERDDDGMVRSDGRTRAHTRTATGAMIGASRRSGNGSIK